MPNEWGEKLKIQIYGRSHEERIGVRISGLPAGESVDLAALTAFLARRAPGRSPLSSARREADIPHILSGLSDGMTDGNALEIYFDNTDARSADYEALRFIPRPGHADYTARLRYGEGEDLRGGGRFSGRMTAPLCAAGGICRELLARRGIFPDAHILSLAETRDEPFCPTGETEERLSELRNADFPTLSREAGEAMKQEILSVRARGDSVGGRIECLISHPPAGLGGALFEGLEGKLASLLFAIPAVKAVEFGDTRPYGSENNDPYCCENGRIITKSNHCGGILGGISSGMPLLFTVTVKPTPSIALPQESVDLRTGEPVTLTVPGRHDACILPRAVPVVEAAAAIVVTDAILEVGAWN